MYYLKHSNSDGTGGSVESQLSYLKEHNCRGSGRKLLQASLSILNFFVIASVVVLLLENFVVPFEDNILKLYIIMRTEWQGCK